MKLLPTFSNVALEKRVASKSKLIIPDQAGRDLGNWYVIETGPDCKAVKIGDQVWFNTKEAGAEEFNGKRVIIVKESEIVAIIRPEESSKLNLEFPKLRVKND